MQGNGLCGLACLPIHNHRLEEPLAGTNTRKVTVGQQKDMMGLPQHRPNRPNRAPTVLDKLEEEATTALMIMAQEMAVED